MIADDVFRSRLQATIASLRYWVPAISDAARIEQIEGHDFWKLSVSPVVATAAPFELMLRTDQIFDISIAGETFEDQPITTLDLFLPLAEAIAGGRVILRETMCTATAVPLSLETRVTLAEGAVWSRLRTMPGSRLIGAGETMVNDRHFVPYRR